MTEERPWVGVGVMIFKEGKVLLGRRKGTHGKGEYAFPGGHLEHLESFEVCARREVLEECGLQISNVQFLFVANVIQYAPKHYAHIGLTADWQAGKPRTLEPKRCAGWAWYSLDSLPEPLFEMARLSFDALRTGKPYYDCGALKNG